MEEGFCRLIGERNDQAMTSGIRESIHAYTDIMQTVWLIGPFTPRNICKSEVYAALTHPFTPASANDVGDVLGADQAADTALARADVASQGLANHVGDAGAVFRRAQ